MVALVGVGVEGASATAGGDDGTPSTLSPGATAAWSLTTATVLARQGWLGMRARPDLSDPHTPPLPLLLCNGLHDPDEGVQVCACVCVCARVHVSVHV